MAFIFEKNLPGVEEVLQKHPSLPSHMVPQRRAEIGAILSGEDDRLLVVQGPCSFYPQKAGLDHAQSMAAVQHDIRDAVLLVERVYIQKPRTRDGWSGIMNQPDPNGEFDAPAGVWASREVMAEAAKHLPIADEVLFPENGDYFEDLISYGALGARNVEGMQHRWAASGFDFPIGVKNERSGGLHSAIDAIAVAQQENRLVMNRKQYRTTANPYAHLILRGGRRPNYDCVSVEEATILLEEAKVKNPAIMIDASHDNAMDPRLKKKTPERQLQVLRQSVRNRYQNPEVFGAVRGFMFEAFNLPGSQKIRPDMRMDGLSITDPCVGLNDTILQLNEIAEEVRRNRTRHV